MRDQTRATLSTLCALLCTCSHPGARAAETNVDYVAVARAYADCMIEHGRDRYGSVHSPLFVTGMNRQTTNMVSPPFPHVKRKPFMPGWERDRELRGSDRNYGHADPLDQLPLLKLLHRLTEVTGEASYAQEADAATAWWVTNRQTGIDLYPWGSHTYWNVSSESGGGTFEYNHVWPYWGQNTNALLTYATALWDHYVYSKTTGDFNRHANSNSHGPGTGMEFPWPGSAMIATWVDAWLVNPDPEYLQAITTILNRWESLRDANGRLAPCTNYPEWAWYDGYVIAANRLDDWAALIEATQPALAEQMRDYGRQCDANYLALADNLLDIKRVGPVMSYLRATGGYNPDRLDLLGGPWQDRKHYAMKGLLLHERMKRNDSPALQERYRRAVLDIAEVYMSVNPEVQWSVWGVNMSHAIELMMVAHSLTGNAAYLHRADHFGRLAVDLFVDEASPLPKFTSHDDFYEIESVTRPSTDVWMLEILELQERLALLAEEQRRTTSVTTSGDMTALTNAPVVGMPAADWQAHLTAGLGANLAGIWDCTALTTTAASVSLTYGATGERGLFLSRREGVFSPTNGIEEGPVDTTGPTVRPVVPTGRSTHGTEAKGLPTDGLELIAADFINHIPTLAEAAPFNGPYRRAFSGKYREPCEAVYGGFKDVLLEAGLLLTNGGATAVTVTVTATLHDTWDDREATNTVYTLPPGEQVLVACAAPDQRFIRRLDLATDTPDAVKLEQLAFVMTPRSAINAPTGGAVDTTPPVIVTRYPADDAGTVPVTANLSVTFDESIQAGTGHITLKRSSDDSTVEAFDVSSSPRLTFSGSQVIIDPSADLALSTGYHVLIDTNAIENTLANPFAGILDAASWNFMTGDTVSMGTHMSAAAPTDNVAISQASADNSTPFRWERPAGDDRNPRDAGQSFLVGGGGLVLDRITVNLATLATSAYDAQLVTLEIFTLSDAYDVVPDSTIAGEVLPLPADMKSAFDAGNTFLTFDITDVTLSAGQHYGFLLMHSAQQSSGDNMLLAAKANSSYTDGTGIKREERGTGGDNYQATGVWTGSSQPADLEFYLQEASSGSVTARTGTVIFGR